ncbi:pyridoxal kinase PdxY [Rhodospirillaceae bacterium KN72]|uniref:pyridoxal kinase n=1 Tax=Pacificispira spongiicola TaxID=2729598 RepID=A0A7Y0DZI9_9PROT|nr:pyridoxal kinase PdxY [Pacificispira spongiicola]NMM44487.1 pyridoxal kinase PdxY [Pacificispira spongiicola]
MAILSIQSHVAFGHVGNDAITLPLQRLRREVWAVHTVMFAAHAGYGAPRGPVFPPETVTAVVGGLEERGLLPRCSAVLSGYLGSAAMGEAVLDALDRVRRANPSALFCCDPVMGDASPGLYVREGIPEFMKARAIPAADIATPNAFELALLTGMRPDTLSTALDGCRALAALGPEIVLLTSLERDGTPDHCIEMMVYRGGEAWVVATPKFDLTPAPNGAGDLTAALFLAHYIETRRPEEALARTASSIHAVFSETRKAGTRELALLAAQDSLVDPETRFAVTKVA